MSLVLDSCCVIPFAHLPAAGPLAALSALERDKLEEHARQHQEDSKFRLASLELQREELAVRRMKEETARMQSDQIRALLAAKIL